MGKKRPGLGWGNVGNVIRTTLQRSCRKSRSAHTIREEKGVIRIYRMSSGGVDKTFDRAEATD